MDKFNEELERQESRIKFRVEVGGIEGMEEYVEWSDMCEFSRPELAYAVNCVARYMFCPKRSHAPFRQTTTRPENVPFRQYLHVR